MTRRRVAASALAVVIVAVITGCANTVAGTATWPGARLDKVVLTAADFPPGVQYDRIVKAPGRARRHRRAAGNAVVAGRVCGRTDASDRRVRPSEVPAAPPKYIVAYDGARMVMTVLTWPLDIERLAATAERCAHFQTFFDPSSEGIPMTTTRLETPRPDALVYQQTMSLGATDSSVYFSFENVDRMAVFGIAFPTPNPAIAVKGTLPQTFLEITGQTGRSRAVAMT